MNIIIQSTFEDLEIKHVNDNDTKRALKYCINDDVLTIVTCEDVKHGLYVFTDTDSAIEFVLANVEAFENINVQSFDDTSEGMDYIGRCLKLCYNDDAED